MRTHDSSEPTAHVDEVIREYLAAADFGQPVTRESVIAAHPHLATELAEFFGGLRAMQEVVDTPAYNGGVLESDKGEHIDLALATSAQCGRLVGRFRLIEKIGSGSFGTVWKAKDIQIDRLVAIKIPHIVQLDVEQRKEFVREARAAGRLKHPNIVRVHEVGEDGDIVYIVRDLIDGVTLADWLRERRPTMKEASELFSKLADAVHHAHRLGVVHRDLKPANVLISVEGEPHVTDFGLAKVDGSEATATIDGRILGTPAYMAPEQASGDSRAADPRTDVYSLGVIYFQLLTGEKPFRGDVHQIFDQVLYDTPPSPRTLESTVTVDQETICLKCLEKSPDKRYASAEELAKEVQRMLRGEPILARPIGLHTKALRWCRRHPARALAGSLLVFICIAGSVVGIHESRLRNQADARARETRRLLYVSDMNRSLRELDDVNLQAVTTLLERYLPAKDQPDLRSFEWYYLWRLLNSDVRTLRGHRERLLFASFSHDGATVASSDYDGVVNLWDVDTGQLKTSFAKHFAPVCAVAFSPDDSTLASCSHDRTVILWDVKSGQIRGTLEHNNQVEKLDFSPRGDVLATTCSDGSLMVWDIATGNCVKTLKADEKQALNVVFSSDGTLLATGGEDTTVKIWKTSTFERIATLDGHDDTVYGLDFSPDGQTLASSGGDNAIILWDVESKMRRHTLYENKGSARSLAFSPDGKTLASTNLDPLIRLWDTEQGALRATIYGHQHQVRSVRFSPDGTRLVTASDDKTVKIWDVLKHSGMIRWSAHSNWIRTVAYSPDGQTLVSCSDDGSVKLWDANTGRPRMTLTRSASEISEVAFSPDGALLAAASDDRSIKLWDVATGQSVSNFVGHADFVNSITFSPDGKLVASGSKDQTVRLYEIPSGRAVASFKAHDGPVTSVRFSPSGTFLATGSNDKTAKLWDATACKLVTTFVGHTDSISGLAFSPDGQTLATASRDTSVRLWTVRSGRQQLALLGHPMVVRRVAYFPDGKLLVTAGADHTLKLWDANTGEERGTLKGHTSGAFGVCVSPDGNSIASGDENGSIILWHAPATVREFDLISESTDILETPARP